MAIVKFEEIKAWQLARDLANELYKITRSKNFAYDSGLKDQVTRAASSVMHNIAEGYDSESNAEFIRFLVYSKRSCTEIQSQLYLALDQKYIDQVDFERIYNKANETRVVIKGFIKYLKKVK